MPYKIPIQCPYCGKAQIEVPYKKGTQEELVLRVEFLESQLHRLMKTNMDLRKTLSKVIK